MNLSHLTGLVGKYLKFLQYGNRLRPVRDWLVILSVASLLLITMAGWSYELFRETSKAGTADGAAGMRAPIRKASLELVNLVFQKRAAERGHYLSDYQFVDPSR